jgi:ubiquinone/menaquinone biosynthesis C-methylase UbiE
MDELPPNHHADYPQFAGAFGYIAGMTMTVGRGSDARLVADTADLSPGDHVLDIGCGPGTAARMVARSGVNVTGVDPSKPMLALAKLLTRFRKSSGEVDWVLSGAENLLVPDASVDTCWSLASVHHWPDLEPGLQEVHRVLKPGGLFLALEKRTEVGAKGNASHGWTAGQAERFASMLAEFDFSGAEVANHDLGKRKVVLVSAHKAPASS